MAVSYSGGTLKISLAEHKKIKRSAGVQDALRALAAKVAAEANSNAGISDGYVSESDAAPNPDLTVSADSARAHVWAKSGEAIAAERRNAVLMTIAGNEGAL